MPQEIVIAFDALGRARSVYNDDLAPVLAALGPTSVVRASHVEPDPDGGWYADLTPVGGPVLRGFKLRQEALDAELAWLMPRLGTLP